MKWILLILGGGALLGVLKKFLGGSSVPSRPSRRRYRSGGYYYDRDERYDRDDKDDRMDDDVGEDYEDEVEDVVEEDDFIDDDDSCDYGDDGGCDDD